MVIISGQVARKDMINKTNTRQIGVQEINILDIVSPIVKYKTIITDLMHSKRILVNDFAETNPYPSSIAVNIPRNDTGLSSILDSILKN